MSAEPGPTLAVLHRAWTFEDLLALPDDGNRYEIVDGALHVSPPPTPLHQTVLDHLAQLVRPAAAQAGCVVKQGVGVRVPPAGGERYVVPDMVVTTGPMPPLYYEPSAVRVVVEVESPRSRLADRGTKRALYADAGIGEYWLLDPGRRTLRLWRLDGEEYVPVDGSSFLPPVDWDALTADD